LFSFQAFIVPRDLHSFPTRRSSDLPLEDLYLDYRKQDREPGELVESVKVPLRDPHCLVASYKLSKRVDQDISAVCSAYAIKLDGDRKSTRLNSSHVKISYAVFCLKK